MKRPTIIYIINSLKIGGAECVVRDLSEYFVNQNWEVVVITLFDHNKEVTLNDKVKLYTLNLRFCICKFYNAIKLFKSILNAYKPEIVHANLFYSIIFTRFIRLFSNFKVLVSTLHSTKEKFFFFYILLRWTNYLGDVLTTVSNFAAVSLSNRLVSKLESIRVIPNGVDVDKFLPLPTKISISDNNAFNFVSIGRLTKYKNHGNLVLAFSKLLKYFPQATLSIVGDGEEEENLLLLIQKLNLGDNVFLTGRSTDVYGYLKKSSFYVHSSLWEGFGLVLAEAMACELVVLSTNFEGAKEIIGEFGMISNGFNDDDIFNLLLEACLLSNDDRNFFGKNARLRIQNLYSISQMRIGYDSLYKEYL